MKESYIKKMVLSCQKIIERRWKKSKKELCGWIIDGHVVWLDQSYCTTSEIYMSDEVAESFHLIGAISFHTHPLKDDSGKESISGADRSSATAWGHEVVFTAKGIYLITPYKKMNLEKISDMEDELQVLCWLIENDDEYKSRNLYEIKAKKIFKCHIRKLADPNIKN